MIGSSLSPIEISRFATAFGTAVFVLLFDYVFIF